MFDKHVVAKLSTQLELSEHKKLDSKAERQLLLIGIANGATEDLFYRGGRTSEAEIRNGPRCQLVLPCLP